MLDTKKLNIKKNLFRVILLLLPIVILVLIEISLRVSNYGGNLDIFKLNEVGDVNEYIFNENFTNRYFVQKGIKTPTPYSQRFSAEKGIDTYRIFCLGASTTQGFPYPVYASYPAYLKEILSKVHPSKNVEVINCGVTAITSHVVLDMQKEIIENYEPDLFIVYTGHNEFYGVLGQGSSLSLFENRTILKLYLSLQKSKTFLLVRDIVNNLFGKDFSEDSEIEHETFMQLVAEDKNIDFGNEVFKRTIAQYEANIEEMAELSKEANVDLLFCNLVSNKRDLVPFGSTTSISNDTIAKINNELSAILDLYKDDIKGSIAPITKVFEIEPTYSLSNYRLAQIYDSLGNYKEASKYYNLACDYDVIRFRAPSIFNEILKQKTDNYKIPLIDVEKVFVQNSPKGIIGNNLLLEHVHPSNHGSMLIAQSIANEMQKNELLQNNWSEFANISASDFEKMEKLNELTDEVVNYILYKLTSTWPYEANNVPYARVGNARTEALAKSLIVEEKGSMLKLHIEYGEELQKEQDFYGALVQYKAALEIEPLPIIYNKIGRIYMALTERTYRNTKDFRKAKEYFTECESVFMEGLKRSPNDIELNFNLGLLYFMRNDRLSESADRYKKVLSIDPKHKKALGQLGELYFRKKELNKAREILETAISIYPENARYHTDLGLILYEQNYVDQAKEYLNKAITLNNDLKAKYFLSQINNKKL